MTVIEYDFGVCPDTGYHDTGERFRCFDCGARGDAADLVYPREAVTREPEHER
jgi:hypothetical protein